MCRVWWDTIKFIEHTVFPDRIYIYVAYVTFQKYHSDDTAEIGERGEKWNIIKQFNAEHRKENYYLDDIIEMDTANVG
jgi:hypothetical protein